MFKDRSKSGHPMSSPTCRPQNQPQGQSQSGERYRALSRDMVKHACLLVTTGVHYSNTYNGECTMIKFCLGTNSVQGAL